MHYKETTFDDRRSELEKVIFPIFFKHVVGIRVRFTERDQIRQALYSSALFQVQNTMYLITAGHCVNEVNDAVAKGWSVSAQLLDAFEPAQKFRHVIPFLLESGYPKAMYPTDEPVDFGALGLVQTYGDALLANGKAPLGEACTEPPPDSWYFIAGFPARNSTLSDREDSVVPEIVIVKKRLHQCPEGLREAPGSFYGESEGVKSVIGMSGGPIFWVSKAESRYGIVAIQRGQAGNLLSGTLIAAALPWLRSFYAEHG